MKNKTSILIIVITALFTVLFQIKLFASHPEYCDVNEQIKSIKNNIQKPKRLGEEDKIYILSYIWSEIKYNFANIDRIAFDPDSLYRNTITKALATTNDIHFYEVIERFMCAFGDGHTQLMNVPYNWNDYFDYIPCSIAEIDKEFYLISIRKNAGIDSTLLGGKIIAIEECPVHEYVVKNYFPEIPASTEGLKWDQAASKMCQGEKGSHFNAKVIKRDGSTTSVSICRNGETTRTEADTYWSIGKPRIGRQMVNLDWLEDNIAVLDIRRFYEQAIPMIDDAIEQINTKASALIIDLRLNTGGSTKVANHLQKYLTPESYFLSFGAQYRTNNGYGRAQGNYRKEYEDFYLGRAYETMPPDTIYVADSIERIKCPVVILIGRYSFSACEDFLVNCYERPDRPLLIGEETGGSTGAPLVLSLPCETSARICTLRILYPYSGKPFVGQGVKPDIEVKQSFDDFLHERDPIMEKAIKEIKTKTN